MNSKKGISLIILGITIIVIIMLATVVLFVSADVVNNAKMSSFASDLEHIEELVEEYYLNNSTLPIEEGVEYQKAGLISLVPNVGNMLSSELDSNGDSEATFYKVDLRKIQIEDTSRGLKENGDASDIYVVSSTTFNIYYVKGQKILNKYYFSLTKKITGKEKVSNRDSLDASNIIITNTTKSIVLTKNTNEWTNNLIINVDTELAAGETIKYLLSGQDITAKVTSNSINLYGILSSDETLKAAFYSNNTNKVLTAQKYKNGKAIAETTINVFNMDMLSGTVVTNDKVTYAKYDDFVLASITGYTDLGGSEVKEARVLYTTKLDSQGNTVPYYNNLPAEITKDYVYSRGVKSAAFSIKLPTDVVDFVVVFIDNAGNISDINSFTVNY